ncbi:hypothetical protein [Burkholderia sp. IMCC1007]|uniref:hypothetical protein n=1 Tax=Burkholderia sp. IMCC1007 TaxID=3004104 RepID=UPI0022B38E17|nr:hypothetical protein [Burkholderia sp. IMCC1007]
MLAPSEVVVREPFGKLGIAESQVRAERNQRGYVYQIDAGGSRSSRQFEVGHDTVRYVGMHGRRRNVAPTMPSDPDKLPTKNVGGFLRAFARAHCIEDSRSDLDAWAEAVTRAAGDHVKLDAVGRLLVKLGKAKLINSAQMARLMTNYVREQRENDALRNGGLAAGSSSVTAGHGQP